MEKIYPDDRFISDRTIDGHIKKLRRKLEAVDPVAKFIQSVYGVGYKSNPSHSSHERILPLSFFLPSFLPSTSYFTFTSSCSRFHHPPPSAWNSAAVSAKRAARAWTRLIRVCWYWRSALSSER